MNAADYIALFDTLSPDDKVQVASHFHEVNRRLESRLKSAPSSDVEKVAHDMFARHEGLFRRLAEAERDGMDDAHSKVRG